MKGFYHSLGKLGVYAQFILWLFAFYWTDSEIFAGIISNMEFPNNSLFLLLIVFTQILLFRNFYYASGIHSFAKDMPLNYQEEETFTQCKKCNIRRKERAHHCRYCNRCIEEMDHHCFSLNNCIGKKNYHYFIGYIFLVEINSTIIFWCTLYKLVHYFKEISIIYKLKYGILVLVSFAASFGVFFLLCFHVYISLVNLTTLEFNYTSLRVSEEKKENKYNDKNWTSYLVDIFKKIIRLFCP